MIWLQLLDAAALEVMNQTKICLFNSVLPEHPFYAPIDAVGFANPVDAAWLHQDGLSSPYADHSWVEVTHCAQHLEITDSDEARCATLRQMAHNGSGRPALSQRHAALCSSSFDRSRWLYKAGAMWFYAAKGSGVSINIGRTRSFTSYSAAVSFLRRALVSNATWEDGTCRGAVVDESIAGGLDSVQVVEHMEGFSHEPHHEIILLRHAECEGMNATSTFVACGQHPHLSSCNASRAGQEALARLSKCTSWDQAISSRFAISLLRKGRPCGRARRASCYHNGSTYLCKGR